MGIFPNSTLGGMPPRRFARVSLTRGISLSVGKFNIWNGCATSPTSAAVCASAGVEPPQHHITSTTETYLFIALGIYAAHSIGERIPLLIPENGAIALNVPLTPSRRGSCSTRTAHPFFFRTLSKIIDELGIKNTLCNPLELKTKGECVAECRNRDLLNVAAPKSVSCAKRGHPHAWYNRTAGQCGMCLPCIYRRASLHKVGWDEENYGRDICTGEVDLDYDKDLANDFRALVSFLRRDVSKHEIASRLLANGPIEVNRLMEYADVFSRSIDEVRDLLRDKGTNEIQRRAGLVP